MTHPHTHEHHPHSGQHDRPGHGPAPEGDTGLAEILDLDAALGAPVMAAALDAASRALDAAPHSVVDLGAGTGTGTLALATRFPDAQIHSLDASATMLDRLGAVAASAGVADRVRTHLVDLDADWPDVVPGAADLAWAALSLHHVSDPARVLRQAWGALRPGGVLVVTEFTGATTYDPADLGTGRDGLGPRLVAVLAAHGYPVTAEWTADLGAVGFAPVERHETALTATGRTTDGARYLALQLSMNRARLTQDLSAADLAALDAAIASLEARTSEVVLSSGRAFWVAVRPAGDEAVTAHDHSDREHADHEPTDHADHADHQHGTRR
ncbi:class I SAM-dependent methyltransferase [Lapillicoccus sp.]|uniref:class I SAM-dependent methyltransferase n=1 Tax=Lapillicoccus sp. TaxID=1909287 RepID=UPI0025DF3DAC|nr:class I SAM-dependent methyltransferase [Lapillicoccus sp.]